MASVRETLEQALGLHRDGRLADAARLYAAVLAREPENPDALHLSGVAKLQGGDAAGAADMIGRAAALRPKGVDIHVHHAQALAALRRLDEAIAAWRRALDLAPGDAAAWFGLGDALGHTRRFAEAEEAFRRAAALSPAIAEYHMARGVALRNLGRIAEAEGAYRKTLELSPQFAEAHANLATVQQQQRRLEDALASYGRAFALNPSFFRAIVQNLCTAGRGRLWLDLNDARRALGPKAR